MVSSTETPRAETDGWTSGEEKEDVMPVIGKSRELNFCRAGFAGHKIIKLKFLEREKFARFAGKWNFVQC